MSTEPEPVCPENVKGSDAELKRIADKCVEDIAHTMLSRYTGMMRDPAKDRVLTAIKEAISKTSPVREALDSDKATGAAPEDVNDRTCTHHTDNERAEAFAYDNGKDCPVCAKRSGAAPQTSEEQKEWTAVEVFKDVTGWCIADSKGICLAEGMTEQGAREAVAAHNASIAALRAEIEKKDRRIAELEALANALING